MNDQAGTLVYSLDIFKGLITGKWYNTYNLAGMAQWLLWPVIGKFTIELKEISKKLGPTDRSIGNTLDSKLAPWI